MDTQPGEFRSVIHKHRPLLAPLFWMAVADLVALIANNLPGLDVLWIPLVAVFLVTVRMIRVMRGRKHGHRRAVAALALGYTWTQVMALAGPFRLYGWLQVVLVAGGSVVAARHWHINRIRRPDLVVAAGDVVTDEDGEEQAAPRFIRAEIEATDHGPYAKATIADTDPAPFTGGLRLLNVTTPKAPAAADTATRAALEGVLADVNVDAEITGETRGPTVTCYQVTPGPGVKVERILGLNRNFALATAQESIRLLAPVPGMSAIGIEIPNKVRA